MSSLDINIHLLNNGYIKVIVSQDNNEIWEETYEKEDQIKTMIDSYESKTNNEFPKALLNKIKSSKDKNVTNNEEQLINYITGYEEKNFVLDQNEDTYIPDIIGKPFENPFSVINYIKREKAFKFLKFTGNDDLQELENYGPSSAYCNGNNILFISGGEKNDGDYLNKFWKIDLTNAEIETSDMASKKNHSMIAIPGSYVFIVGGQNKETFFFDLNENKFYGWKNLNKYRIEPALILVNNYLYCFDNMNSNSNDKFTFEKTDIYSEDHTWEICEPNISSLKMNQKYFGVAQYNGDIIFIGGNLDLEGEEDKENLNERKNYKYNINEDTIEESDIPYIDYNFKEKTFLKYNDRISYILPDFSRHHPEVMFYQKEKSVIKFLKGYSKKKLEEKEKEEKNNHDFSPIKIGVKFNLNQPKENENEENLNDENEEVKNQEENENQNQEENEQINLNNDLEQKYNSDVKEINENASQKHQENFEINMGENPELNAQFNLRGQNINVDVNPNLNLGLEGKGDIQNLGINNPSMNINISQPNLGVNVGQNMQMSTNLNIQNPLDNVNINRDININGLNPNLNANLTNLGQTGININGPNINIPQTNLDIQQPGINANINLPNPQINGGFGVTVPGTNLQGQNQFILTGIIVGAKDNPQKYQKMKVKNPNLEIVCPNSNMNLNLPTGTIDPNIQLNVQNPNLKVPGVDINTNIQQPNLNVPGIDINANLQQPNLNVPGVDINTNIQQPNLNVPGVDINTNIQQPNLNVPGVDINANLQQPNLNVPGVDINTNIQKPNLNLPGVDINTNIQKPNLNLPGVDINTNIQQPNINVPGVDVNANIQQPNINFKGPNLNIPSPNVNVNAQVPNIGPGVYNNKGQFIISGVIVGFKETDPKILKYKNSIPTGLNTNISAQMPNPTLDLNANLPNVNAQMPNVNINGPNVNLGTNINSNLTRLGNTGIGDPNLNLNINPTHSGVEINGPQLNMNSNNFGASINVPKVDITGTNPNLGGEININNNLNTGLKSQMINMPNIQITNPIVGGNLAGNLSTNVQNSFNPNQELKPVDLKMGGNINIQNPQTLYDTKGNFNYSGVIPSKNDNNNINSSINNLNMSNLLLLQNNRVDQIETKLSKTKLGVNKNVSQNTAVNNQINVGIKNDNKIGMSVNLGGIGINMNK